MSSVDTRPSVLNKAMSFGGGEGPNIIALKLLYTGDHSLGLPWTVRYISFALKEVLIQPSSLWKVSGLNSWSQRKRWGNGSRQHFIDSMGSHICHTLKKKRTLSLLKSLATLDSFPRSAIYYLCDFRISYLTIDSILWTLCTYSITKHMIKALSAALVSHSKCSVNTTYYYYSYYY